MRDNLLSMLFYLHKSGPNEFVHIDDPFYAESLPTALEKNLVIPCGNSVVDRFWVKLSKSTREKLDDLVIPGITTVI